MKIGMSSWACSWALGISGYPQPDPPLQPLDLLQKASRLQAEVLQIADNLPLHLVEESVRLRLAEQAGSLGIELEIGTRGLAPQHLYDYLELARQLRARLVRTLPHDGRDRPDFATALQRLQQVLPFFEQAGMLLVIENHDFYPASWLRHLVERADSPCIGVCLDAVNNLGQGEGFREVLAELGPLTRNFHCKDFQIRRKPSQLGFDVTGAPAGSGMLNLREVRQALADPDISWVIESWLPWQGSLKDTLELEEAWLAQGMDYLRQFRSRNPAASLG